MFPDGLACVWKSCWGSLWRCCWQGLRHWWRCALVVTSACEASVTPIVACLVILATSTYLSTCFMPGSAMPKSLNVFSNLDHYCRHHYCAHSPHKENEVPGFTICINFAKELICELVSSLIFWWISILVYSFPLPLPAPPSPPLLHSSALVIKTKVSCMLDRGFSCWAYTPQVLSTCFTIFQKLIPCVHPEHNASDCSILDRSCRAEMLWSEESMRSVSMSRTVILQTRWENISHH